MMFKSDFQFKRCVDRYKGDFRTRKFTCSEHFLVMSFAQLTAGANEKRHWRIYGDYAQVLIKQARPLYVNDPNFRMDIDNIVPV